MYGWMDGWIFLTGLTEGSGNVGNVECITITWSISCRNRSNKKYSTCLMSRS